VDRDRSRVAVRTPTSASAGVFTAAVLLLFVAWPASRLLHEGLQWSAAAEVFGSRRLRGVIGFTVLQAVLSTVATLLLALPAAWLIGRHTFFGRRFLVALWSAPFTLPAVVVGAAFLALLPSDFERSLLAIVCAHMFFNIGMVARVIGEAWSAVDERFEQSAATMGAPPRDQRLLVLRLLAPTAFSVAGLVMALSLTSFAIVQILGGPSKSTIETEIYRQTFQGLRLDRASVLSLLQLLLVSSVLLLTTRRATGVGVASRTPQRAPRLVSALIIGGMTVVTLSPLVVLLERATRWPSSLTSGVAGRSLAAFTSLRLPRPGNGLLSAPINSVAVSLRAASLATLLALGLAACATVGARTSRLVSWLTTLPLAVSGVTLGLGALLGFASTPIAWRSKWWMVPVLQAMVAFPYALRIIRPAVESLDVRLSQVAATLGARPVQVWWRVAAPILRVPFRSAAALAGAVALGEFGATSFLVRERSETIPVVISVLSGRPGSQLQAQAAALAVILAVVTTLLSLLAGATKK
jgi:thiamine transport system permease protein